MTRQTSQEKSSNAEPIIQATSPLPPLESSFQNMKRSRMAENEMTNSQLEDEASTKTSSASGSGVLQKSVPLDAWDRQELTGGGASDFAPDEDDSSQGNDDYDNNDKNDNFEERFHELYVDEEDAPAFLPSSARSTRGNSNGIMSLLKSVVIDKQSPFRNEPGSSSLPTSPDVRQQQPPSAQQLRSPLRHERTHQLSTAEEFTTEGTNSVGSSFSDVSGKYVGIGGLIMSTILRDHINQIRRSLSQHWKMHICPSLMDQKCLYHFYSFEVDATLTIYLTDTYIPA